jgi:alpha/beta superfamily hydrolase
MKVLRKLRRIGVILILFSVSIVINQDVLIFPGAASTIFLKPNYSPFPDVIEHVLSTADGHSLNVWELPSSRTQKKVALIFHGNGGDVRMFFSFQKWFRKIGVASYDFDYRGFGKSTGWMSEELIYQDAEQVINFIIAKEGISAENLIIMGISVGSGAAANLAQKFKSRTLLLASGYSSLPDVAQENPALGFLAGFLNYNFPTAKYLEKMYDSCIIISHGKQDEVIPFGNALRLKEAAEKHNKVDFIPLEKGKHNDTFWLQEIAIIDALNSCDTRIKKGALDHSSSALFES